MHSEITIFIIYLLKFVDHVDNYEKYCSKFSDKFIKDTLKARKLKDIVLIELVALPPIKDFYCGGYEYWRSISRFKSLQ